MTYETTIHGARREGGSPLWTAVLQITRRTPTDAEPEGEGELDVRTIFETQRRAGGPPHLKPGTMVVQGVVKSVKVALGPGPENEFRARNPTQAPVRLLVWSDTEGWAAAQPTRIPSGSLCVGGEIPLDAPAVAFPDVYPFDQLSRVCLLATGLSFDGRVTLPAKLLVPGVSLHAAPDGLIGLRVTLPRQALREATRKKLIEAFRGWAGAFEDASNAPSALSWASLELVDPTALPAFSWIVEHRKPAAPERSALVLEPGAFRMTLRDQRSRRSGPPARATLTVSPAVRIRYGHPAGEMRLEFEQDQSQGIRERLSVEFSGDPAPLDEVLRRRLRPEHGKITWLDGLATSVKERAALEELTKGGNHVSFRRAVAALARELARWAASATYAARTDGSAWTETVLLTGIDAAYDPIATAETLRRQHGAERSTHLLDSAGDVLWGFVPLADGVAQLPFLNLTEDAYEAARRRTLLPHLGVETRSVAQGAATFGNDSAEVVHHGRSRGEQPWSVTLLNARVVKGSMTLTFVAPTPDERKYSVASVDLRLEGIDAVLDGFLWLATESPSANDALPTLDDWVAGATSIRLRSMVNEERFPSPFVVSFNSIAISREVIDSGEPGERDSALLGPWSFGMRAAADVIRWLSRDDGTWPLPIVDRSRALAWRRHPDAPAVQLLPLTQSRSPANHPSASRQLAPHDLPSLPWTSTDAWSFVAHTGARSWPIVTPATSAVEWNKLENLSGMALLGLPGVVVEPPFDAGVLRYRLTIPVADEVYALSRLRTNDDRRGTPATLWRETFGQWWQDLEERAFLARGENDEALANNTISNALEPFTWSLQQVARETGYPGKLTLHGLDGSMALEKAAGLRGLHGKFRRTNRLSIELDPNGELELVAGSAVGFMQDGRLRDQRGLWRGGTSLRGKLLKTPVRLEENQAETNLVTTGESLTLKCETTWGLWFRDVPVLGDASDLAGSALRRGVNDPGALSRAHVHRAGYEWRLWHDPPMGEAAGRCLRLGSLEFYPLRLATLTLAGDDVQIVEVVGRLQLPLAPIDPRIEQTAHDNAVRLRFVRRNDGVLHLDDIAAEVDDDDPGAPASSEAPTVEWPLARAPGAPRLVCSTFAVRRSIEVTGWVEFWYLGVLWKLPPKTFNLGDTAELRYTTDELRTVIGSSTEVTLSGLTCTLRLEDGRHRITCTFTFRWGGEGTPIVAADATVDLLDDTRDVTFSPFLDLGRRVDLVAEPSRMTFDSARGAIQISWGALRSRAAGLQILPGLRLGDEADALAGFAVMTLRTVPTNDDATGDTTNRLVAGCAYAELVARCDWNEMLGEVALGNACRTPFSSSAGRMVCGITLSKRGDAWRPELLLNGILEVRNLISWPLQTGQDASTFVVRRLDQLAHVRHAIRILLVQHEVPAARLTRGRGLTLFTFREGASWSFLATVEHQLASLDVRRETTMTSDHRFTVVQEVRISTPVVLATSILAASNSTALDPASEAARSTIGAMSAAHLSKRVAQDLGQQLPRLVDALALEASAALLVRRGETVPQAMTTLQHLPDGCLRAGLAQPEDFKVAEGAWTVFTTPFVGRLQSIASDTANPPAGEAQVDPILALQRRRPGAPAPSNLILALTSRRVDRDLTFKLPPLDQPSALDHSWRWFHENAIDTAWRRALSSPQEGAPAAVLSTVLRASLVKSLGRNARPASLEEALGAAAPSSEGFLRWRPADLLVFQTFAWPDPYAEADRELYGFVTAGATACALAHPSRALRHVALTLVPSSMERQPLIAISPFGALEYHQQRAGAEALVIAELLCADAGNSRLERIGEVAIPARPQADLRAFAVAWAQQMRANVAPDSAVAVLRLRRVSATEQGAVVTYDFVPISGATSMSAALLPQHARPLRAAPARLRFVEGQFGGSRPPTPTSFEAAAPRVARIRPIHQDDSTPFGVSALQLEVECATNARGHSGPISGQDARLWWMALFHAVQFQASSKTHALLPPLWRSQAMPALLPALSHVPLPRVTLASSDGGAPWQPVLPGDYRATFIGGRPGAPFAIRPHLITQDLGHPDATCASSAVPIQQRFPRPASLPASEDVSVSVQPSLADAARFVLTAASVWQPPLGERLLELRLISPPNAELSGDGSDLLQFAGTVNSGLVEGWTIAVSARGMDFEVRTSPDGIVTCSPTAEHREAWRRMLSVATHGSVVVVEARVAPRPEVVDRIPMRQTLKFGLRVRRAGASSLPLRPITALFHDPAYDRRLGSATSRTTVARGGRMVTISLDRRLANPDTVLVCAYFDSQRDAKGVLEIKRVRDGISTSLGADVAIDAGRFALLDLAKQAAGERGGLRPKDMVLVALRASGFSSAPQARVFVVEEPILPTCDAAYALIRTHVSNATAECRRFAWSPQPTRIDLVSPDEMEGDHVRRRATFQWHDTVRFGELTSYAVQKIAPSGAMRFPAAPLDPFRTPDDLKALPRPKTGEPQAPLETPARSFFIQPNRED